MAKIVQMPVAKRATSTKKNEVSEKEALKTYHDRIKSNPVDQKPYERLMILYRRSKEYKKELSIINAGIRAFEALYSRKKHTDRKINSISNQLNKALGLLDKKSKNIFDHEPVATWKKRKEIVLKKLEKN